ncbi:MAG: hypothetical protein NTW59_05235 [Candidatus Diapherotrites archaeon]|nr:hypothetical protein [Candidatus Diapherotrites archaeon]
MLLDALLLVFSFALLGAGLKVVDLSFDERLFSRRIALLLAVPGALLFAFTLLADAQSATLLMAVLVSCLLTRKVDNVAFFAGAAIVVALSFLLNAFSLLLFLPLAALVVAGIFDELGNNFADKRKVRGAAGFLLQQRFFMKICAFALLLAGLLDLLHFAAFICFDAGYAAVEAALNKKR